MCCILLLTYKTTRLPRLVPVSYCLQRTAQRSFKTGPLTQSTDNVVTEFYSGQRTLLPQRELFMLKRNLHRGAITLILTDLSSVKLSMPGCYLIIDRIMIDPSHYNAYRMVRDSGISEHVLAYNCILLQRRTHVAAWRLYGLSFSNTDLAHKTGTCIEVNHEIIIYIGSKSTASFKNWPCNLIPSDIPNFFPQK